MRAFRWIGRSESPRNICQNWWRVEARQARFGLYTLYQKAPDSFRAQYDDLLSSTGLADAVTLAKHFGIDIQSVDFWRSSLDVIRGQIADVEVLVG